MSEGTRTPDRRDHNPELYQLSYAHRGSLESSSGFAAGRLLMPTRPEPANRAAGFTPNPHRKARMPAPRPH